MILLTITKYLSNLTPRRIWNEFITVLGIFGAIIGIYSFYESYTKSPYLIYKITSIASFVNVKNPTPDLQIYFNQQDIKSIDMDLMIIKVTIKNEGKDKILQAEYDQYLPLGFKILNSQILGQPTIIESSNTYISSQLNPRSKNRDTIELNKIILEPDAYATLEITALTTRNKPLSFEALGKIAGQKEIRIVKDDENLVNNGLFKLLFAGDIFIQIGRTIFYGLIFLITAIISIILSYTAREKIKRKRATRAKLYINAYIEPLIETTTDDIMLAAVRLLSATDGDINNITQFLEFTDRHKKFNEYCSLIEKNEAIQATIESEKDMDAVLLKIKKQEMALLYKEITRHFKIALPLNSIAQKKGNNYLPNKDLANLIRKIKNQVYQNPPPVKLYSIDFDYLTHEISKKKYYEDLANKEQV